MPSQGVGVGAAAVDTQILIVRQWAFYRVCDIGPVTCDTKCVTVVSGHCVESE